MMNTQLLHALPAEQARCRELVRHYVAIGSAGAFASALAAGYESQTGLHPEIYICRASAGAGLV